jgi:hypothetical protein
LLKALIVIFFSWIGCISPETITLNLTKSQERHLLIFQALMILNELVSDRVTIKETHFVYNKPKFEAYFFINFFLFSFFDTNNPLASTGNHSIDNHIFREHI